MMFKAKTSASSGDVRFLNDFALGNIDGICEDFEGENKNFCVLLFYIIICNEFKEQKEALAHVQK